MSDIVYSSPAARGLGLARVALAQAVSHDLQNAAGFAAAKWGPTSPAASCLKAAVVAGTTTSSTWAGPLADTSLSDEFIAFARGRSVFEQLAPAMRQVEFGVRVAVETAESIVAYWTGQGAAKAVSFGSFDTLTLEPHKLTSRVIVTRELLRSSNADVVLRSSLANALAKAQDTSFLNDTAATSSSPAGILNGVAPIASSGNASSDIAALFASFTGDFSAAFLIAHPSVGAAIGLRNPLAGVTARGGELGVPVLTSKYVAGDSSGSALILLDASAVIFASGPVEVPPPALHASVQMDSAPTNDAATGTGSQLVNLFQSNAAGLGIERFLSWQAAPGSVAWVEGANYAST